MIVRYAYDVEILPNFFSVCLVDIKNYFNTFEDCVDSKGRPIPLTQCLSVSEIKDKLDKVNCYKFYIIPDDDKHLLDMIAFFNNLQPHVNDKGVPIRNDLFGFNSFAYDKLMVAGFLMFANQSNNTKELITKLYDLSKHIIEMQDKDKDIVKGDFMLNNLHNYKLPYTDVDVMRIFSLNKVGTINNSDGSKSYFGKSLKQTSINLQWFELLEYDLPPISELDYHFYQKINHLKSIPADKLNNLVNKWDRYILPEWIDDTIHYNMNDVFIVCEMVRLFLDEVKLRYNISKAYKVNVLNSSRSNISDVLFDKFYSEFSGLHEKQWKGKKTERTAMAFNKVIFPFIKFKTKPLQDLLEEMKSVTIYSIGKEGLGKVADKYPNLKYLKVHKTNKSVEGWFEITINNLTYTIATGGLHSQDIPRELKSKINLRDEDISLPSTGRLAERSGATTNTVNKDWSNLSDNDYIYTHADVASFYPSLICEYNIAPAHLDNHTFVKLVDWLRVTRVEAKHSKEDYIDGIPKDVLAQVLKIVINSIYGKLGYEYGNIYDRLAVLKVTINGQLLLLKLCEELELAGIQVMSANTDGIVVKVFKHQKEIYDKILNDWCEETQLGLDSEEYYTYINRDINNYIIKELNGKVSYKGALNPNSYLADLSKGYDMPIVAKAVENYFLNGIPIMETLKNEDNILNFCKTQNINKNFKVVITGKENKEIQRQVRFYVSNKGSSLFKVDIATDKYNNLCAGYKVNILNTLDDKDISLRDINYGYYESECIKIIDPIKLRISPSQKANRNAGTKSGKALLKKHSGDYLFLFDDL